MLHWKLKACTRCGGDLFISRDLDGWFEQCLQCSYRRELNYEGRQPVPVGVRRVQKEDWSKEKEE